MKNILRILCVVLGAALAVVGTYYFVFINPLNAAPPPVLGEVQDFELIDIEGKKFSKSDQLNGKVWVADLVFTSCQMTCPMLTRKMKNVYLSYELEEGVRFVSLSVDPENDKPEVLKKYVADHDINASKWYFLTGDMQSIRDLAVKGFKLAAADDPNLHSDRFVLIDQKSRVRGYYDPKDKQDLKRLFHEIALVLKERQKA